MTPLVPSKDGCFISINPWVGKIPWRRERLPTPVFWPREFHGLYSPWSGKESDTTEQLSLHYHLKKIVCEQFSTGPALVHQDLPEGFKTCNFFFSSDVLESLPDGWTSAKFFSSIGADPHQHPAGFLSCSCE